MLRLSAQPRTTRVYASRLTARLMKRRPRWMYLPPIPDPSTTESGRGCWPQPDSPRSVRRSRQNSLLRPVDIAHVFFDSKTYTVIRTSIRAVRNRNGSHTNPQAPAPRNRYDGIRPDYVALHPALIVFVFAPLFGRQAAISVAIGLLIIMLAVCWLSCVLKVVQAYREKRVLSDDLSQE
jgi:hypothetical protein